MTTIQQQARALGDPTRHEIFRLVSASPSPLGVAELTAQVGHNHNTVRQHLAKLVEAGLLQEERAVPVGRGRPRQLFRVAPTAESRWGVVGPYERLAVLLAEIVRTGDDAIEVGRRAGRRDDVAVPMAPGGVLERPVQTLVAEMARQGFEPQVATDAAEVDIALHACPFESAVVTDPATVCGLHQGMIEGVAESVGGLVIDQLVIGNPGAHECHVHCHVDATPEVGPRR